MGITPLKWMKIQPNSKKNHQGKRFQLLVQCPRDSPHSGTAPAWGFIPRDTKKHGVGPICWSGRGEEQVTHLWKAAGTGCSHYLSPGESLELRWDLPCLSRSHSHGSTWPSPNSKHSPDPGSGKVTESSLLQNINGFSKQGDHTQSERIYEPVFFKP